MPHISEVIHEIREHLLPHHTGTPAVSHVVEGADGNFEGDAIARVAHYQFQPGGTDVVLERVEQELLPLLKQQPGYLSYEAHRLDGEQGVSISCWATQEHADAAHETIETWAQARIGEYVVTAERYMSNVKCAAAS